MPDAREQEPEATACDDPTCYLGYRFDALKPKGDPGRNTRCPVCRPPVPARNVLPKASKRRRPLPGFVSRLASREVSDADDHASA